MESNLPYLSNKERLNVYQLLTDGCHHLWSKGKIQAGKLTPILQQLITLAHKDPYFSAHLVSYVIALDNNDLKVATVYANALSPADGLPFSPGSKYKKPNLRYVSDAAVQLLPPPLIERILELIRLKFGVKDILNEASHNPKHLSNAIFKYIRYREINTQMMRGIKKAGLGNIMKNIYRSVHAVPTDQSAAILRWQQKGKKIKFEDSAFGFEGLSDLEIAEKIRRDKLSVLSTIGALPKISPPVAVALLEQATGNQAVILRKVFEDAGVLQDPEVKKLYQEKILTAKTALDRVENISKEASEAVKQVLKEARSEKRKESTAGLGKIFVHLDTSGSMENAIEVAKKAGAILAEAVNNPKDNFRWGTFSDRHELLPIPSEFVEDAFKAILFGRQCDGGTDAYQLYPTARESEADIDVFISDGAHNTGELEAKIKKYHEQNPDKPKPKVMLWVKVSGMENADTIKEAYESNGIPVAVIEPKALTSSALVGQTIRQAIMGPMQIISEIMDTELLHLPDWYATI